MPFIRILTSVTVPPTGDALLRDLSALLARELGKPEGYVMTCLEAGARMTFGGSGEPTCYVEVKNVGTFTPAATARLSGLLTEQLAAALAVAPNRVYIEFADASPHLWGHDGDTFA